ncbi:formate-dependent nitrite reductase complex subunit NrfG [mine drainage metagenome]|uniref:Formate-dependent nitrite reductase complex subunit NrfG n=1 Tax=mine drainage metagenome TaxID=410659 RepID=A0A1J5QBQ0_9ZZZZ
MNVFIGIAAFMTLLVVAWLAYPLLRPRKNHVGISSQRLNIDIHRDQLKALETDLARAVISQQDFEATRDELQLRLLDDTQTDDSAIGKGTTPGFWTARRSALVIAVSLPLLAAGLYLKLGDPRAIDPQASSQNDSQKVQQMVDSLVAKLKANPNNPEGWAMLARSYKVMGRMAEAQQAFVNTGDLLNTNPDLMVDYADVLAAQTNSLEGKPLELVNKALAINPTHPMGLMMSGVAAYRRADYKLAIAQWEKIMPLLDPASQDAQQVQADIDDARVKAGLPPAAKGVLPEAGKLPPVPQGAATDISPDMINQMVDRLAARLKDNPDDATGWEQLARAYTVQGRTAEAAQASAKAKLASQKKP